MFQAIGVDGLDDLLAGIPAAFRLTDTLKIAGEGSEQEVRAALESLAAKNTPTGGLDSFLGAGSYRHHIPSIVPHILSRSEFYSSYTPYQAEISQGTLQAIFEYQTLICQLTGMEVANASLYDGASALAEAVLMARRISSRPRVLVSSTIHPEYRQVVETYVRNLDLELVELPWSDDGGFDREGLLARLDERTACVLLQTPNYFGVVEDLAGTGEAAHARGALFVTVNTEPVALGLLKPPGDFGADIAVGEGQSLGIPMSFGGPSLGLMATRMKYVRKMPGRLVGETVDTGGRRGFVLTLATREQHIRREKATSNICTNQGLCALAAAVTLCTLGREGLRELAELNLKKATQAKALLCEVDGVTARFSGPSFNEFVLETPMDADRLLEQLRARSILGGVAMGRDYPGLEKCLLVTVTECVTAEAVSRLADALGEILEELL